MILSHESMRAINIPDGGIAKAFSKVEEVWKVFAT
jgi:hypothetical protein